MGFLKIAGIAVAGIIVLALIGGGSGGNAPGTKPIEMTDLQKAQMAQLIQANGYMCPKAKLATAMGPEPRGSVIRVRCGPADREGVYENLMFRAIVRPDNSWLVEPWTKS